MTWPRPSPTESAELYEAGEYYRVRAMADDTARQSEERVRSLLARVGHRVETALDFGAGRGNLVTALRAMSVAADGVEPSAAARKLARAEHGLVLHARIDDAPRATYDLATLVHSLEHVEDPVAVLAAVRSRVAVGGTLFVEVPHASTVELWRPEPRRWILDLPAHLYHFTPASLTALIAEAGFRVRDVRLFNCDAVEWLLALRTRSSQEPGAGAAAPLVRDAPPSPPHDAERGVLARLRRLVPGRKFQVFATLA
jgi:2-polyprenyl-3-methyl-5-hydroxy-6-metoxy-1,4-benzoquinol methylase